MSNIFRSKCVLQFRDDKSIALKFPDGNTVELGESVALVPEIKDGTAFGEPEWYLGTPKSCPDCERALSASGFKCLTRRK